MSMNEGVSKVVALSFTDTTAVILSLKFEVKNEINCMSVLFITKPFNVSHMGAQPHKTSPIIRIVDN